MLKDHPNGCISYYKASLDLYFADEPCCDICPLLETYARKQCRMTGTYLPNERHSYGLRLYDCPLVVGDQKTNAGEMMQLEQDDLRNG